MKLSKHRWRKFILHRIEGDQAMMAIDKPILDFLKRVNIKSKIAIDGGCNVGVMSLYFSLMVGKGKVLAYDPQSVILDVAKENAIVNGRHNIEFFNYALSDKSGENVGFTSIDYRAEYISSGGIKTEPGLSGSEHCGSVQTLAIDDLNLDNVGLIKLDIEGYEPKALIGMWKTIDRCKPHMVIELSDGYLGEEGVVKMVNEICSHGYSVSDDKNHNYFFKPV